MASCSSPAAWLLNLARIGCSKSPTSLCAVGLQAAYHQQASRNYSTKQESKIWQQKPNRNPRLSIILTEDVRNLGVKGQIVKVKHGYGRNHLLPQKKAVYATHHNITTMKAFQMKKEEVASMNIDSIVNYLHGKTLSIQHDPNDVSAIFEQHISRAFYETLYLYLPLDCIELENPITDFDSEHTVGLRLDHKTTVQVPLVVERTLTKKKQRRLEQVERFRKKLETKAKVENLEEEE